MALRFELHPGPAVYDYRYYSEPQLRQGVIVLSHSLGKVKRVSNIDFPALISSFC